MSRLFRYLPEKYLASTLDGNVLFRSLSYYRDYERDSVRGDYLEGNRAFRPDTGLLLTNVETGEKFLLPREHFQPKVNSEDIFVSCMSTDLKTDLFEEFDTTVCVEILDPEKFVEAIRVAVEKEHGKTNSDRLIAKSVDYYRPSDPIGATWALPERIVFSKEERYSRQAEHRIAFPTNDGFKFENVNIEIGDFSKAKREGVIHKTFLASIGDIRKLAKVHRKS